MNHEYYIVIDNCQQGPFSLDDLRLKIIYPDTLIWRAGLTQWVNAKDLPEVAEFITASPCQDNSQEAMWDDNGWFAMLGESRLGPATISQLIESGISANTPVWHPGMNDWAPASTQQILMDKLTSHTFSRNNRPDYGQNTQYGQQQPDYGQNPQYRQQQQPNYGQNPQYGQQQPDYGQNTQYGQQQPNYGQNQQYGQQQPNYGQNQQYGQQQPNYGQNQQYGQRPGFNTGASRTNWLPWAIVATILGFITGCLGGIIGVVGILKANKANDLFKAGYDSEGEMANNSAKSLTIIAFIISGVSLIVTGFSIKNISLF